MEIRGRTALITGAARRIGRALAATLADAGMHVAVHYHRSAADAHELVDSVTTAGGRAVALAADLTEDASVARLVAEAGRALGPVQVLVNNASTFEPRTLAETGPAELRADQAIHGDAAYVLSKSLAEQLPAGESGAIVNLLDWRASRIDPAYLSYSLSKATLLALTRGLARALAPAIRVNGIAPGAILPPEHGDDDALEQAIRELPAGRVGTPEDIARACLYLIRDADYVTGVVIPVDGGRHLL